MMPTVKVNGMMRNQICATWRSQQPLPSPSLRPLPLQRKFCDNQRCRWVRPGPQQNEELTNLTSCASNQRHLHKETTRQEEIVGGRQGQQTRGTQQLHLASLP